MCSYLRCEILTLHYKYFIKKRSHNEIIKHLGVLKMAAANKWLIYTTEVVTDHLLTTLVT